VTVIAYSRRHRVLAADSRSSDAFGMHLTDCRKVFRLASGAVIGTAGDSDDREVRALLAKIASPDKLPPRHALADLKCNFGAILVFPSEAVFLIDIWHREFQFEGEWAASIEEISPREKYVAVGCGAQFAYGAMEVGSSPSRAVEAACRRDSACALPVQSIRLGRQK
jgi:20S proteasome alpha/beta subunit